MDPVTDLPPMTAHLADHVVEPPPALPTNHPHPPYPEMIIQAIAALKDRDGSSKQAISKYIEKVYTNLPPTHSVLLTHHLKNLRNQGQLIMVKYSYMLAPRSGQFQPPTSTGYPSTFDFTETEDTPDVNAPTTGLNLENSISGSSKRKPGRPPKNRSDSGLGVQGQMQAVQPYNAEAPPLYQPQFQYDVGAGQDLSVNYASGSDFQGNPTAGSEPLFASLGLGDDGVAVPPPQPTENSAVKKGRGRPPKVKRGRGRPRRIGVGPVTVPLSGNVLAPRRRPKRAGRLNVGVGENGLGSRRSGRPYVSRFGRLTGRPMVKPSKVGPGTAVIVTDPRQLVVYQELKTKYELLQSKVKELANVVKPCIDPNYGTVALQALQELEALAGAETTNGPSHGQVQEPEPVSVSVPVSGPYSQN
ncbi:hypothetical protein L2E82_36093 [Cichorium intybus]|uniref:Uncharacterized protein n=1 Tax=Cichorium intybus TaxID=13427 RepID=A0ACB9BQK0_CICIN|nr:hypothetical protein L2E82_36093 [Cichorium intybus]